jgi:hypothetical protein
MGQISHPAATADHSAFDMVLALVKLLSDPAQLTAVAAAQESARAILAGAQAEAETIRTAARAKLDKASALLAALGPTGEGEST